MHDVKLELKGHRFTIKHMLCKQTFLKLTLPFMIYRGILKKILLFPLDNKCMPRDYKGTVRKDKIHIFVIIRLISFAS